MREMLMCALGLLAFVNVTLCQSELDNKTLTIQTYGHDGSVDEVTLHDQEAVAFDIPQFINENRDLRRLIISGVFKTNQKTDVINFDSKRQKDSDAIEVCTEVKTTIRPYLGVSVKGRDDLAGVDIKKVLDNSPALVGRILVDETITAINEEVINSYCDLQAAIRNSEPGALATVALSAGSRNRTVQVRMGSREINNIGFKYCDEVPVLIQPLQGEIAQGVVAFDSYPNPTRSTTQWSFSSDSDEATSFHVLDMNGTVVHQENYNDFRGQIRGVYDFKNESNGTYLLVVKQGTAVYESKVLFLKN